MKKVGLFVLALIAVVIASDDKNIEEVAKRFNIDVAGVQACLKEVGIDAAEMNALLQKWNEQQDDDISFNEEVKQSLIKYSNFLGCILENNEMMVGTKLVADKIFESLEKDKEIVKPLNKEDFTKCISSLNEDSKMTREDRVLGLIFCIASGQMDKDKERK